MGKMSSTVCVTGGASYIGSWLVKKLLDQGHVVHATLRNLGDKSKLGMLKELHGAESRLSLFEADIYDAEKYEAAIRGCEFVFLVATPYSYQHDPQNIKYKDTIEAAVDAVRIILRLCEESGSVRRVVYTGSVTAAAPLKEDGSGYKDSMDELCWTPLHLSFPHSQELEKEYTLSKTLAEKEALSHNDDDDSDSDSDGRRGRGRRVEVVSLACGLVGGDTILPYAPLSVQMNASPLTGDPLCYTQLMFLQALLGSVPLVHIEDICEAHAFCIEPHAMAGRFLCAGAYPSMHNMVDYIKDKYHPQGMNTMTINEVEGGERGMKSTSTKLTDLGFEYKYGMEQILDDSVRCMKRLGGV